METNIEPHHPRVSIIKAIVVIILFSVSLFLLWRQRLNSPVIDQVKNGEESALVVKTINDSTDYTDIDVQIPQFTNASKAFNKKIEDHVRERVAEHKTETAENWQARFETQGSDGDLPKIPKGDGDKMYFYAKFDAPEQNNSEYISVLTRFGGYTGGAHGYEEVVTYNFDVKNNREIGLADLFINDSEYLNKISKISRDVLVSRFTESFSNDFDSVAQRDLYIKQNIQPMVYEGTDPGRAENFANFTFTKDKLIIHFAQYQVAPYVAGLQQVEIRLPLQ